METMHMPVYVEHNCSITLPEKASCAVVWYSETRFQVHGAHAHPFSVADATEVWVVFPEYGKGGLLLEVVPVGELVVLD